MPNELQGLIDSYVREEILFRGGVAMGLDRDDLIIRRRVQQKMVVISEESSVRPAPVDAELEGYLSMHAARYGRPAVIGFDQVMLDPRRHGSALKADLAATLARLTVGAKPDTMGDSSLLQTTTAAIPADLLARDYGDDFAASLATLPVGTWSGPVTSGYGVHLVRVNSRIPGRAATLEEVRTAVERDYENDRRSSASEDYYQ